MHLIVIAGNDMGEYDGPWSNICIVGWNYFNSLISRCNNEVGAITESAGDLNRVQIMDA